MTAQDKEVLSFEEFINYLKKYLSEDDSSPVFVTALAGEAHHEAIRKFIGDPQTRSTLLQSSCTKGIFCVLAFLF